MSGADGVGAAADVREGDSIVQGPVSKRAMTKSQKCKPIPEGSTAQERAYSIWLASVMLAAVSHS